MKPKTADMPPTSQAPQTAGAGTLSKADTPARSANRGAKNAAATTTAASARAKGTSAPLPGGANSQLAQFANQLLNPARALNSWLAASSIAELRRDIAAAPEAFALLLQIRILDPILLIEGLRALSNLKSHPAFNGDTTAWFATQAGLSYKFTNQLNKAASWLYDPHAFIGVTRKKAKKAAAGDTFNTQLTPQELRRIRKEQSELRLLFRRYEASAHVIVTCMQQTNFLAAPARMQTGHVIRRVLQRLGHNPNPHLVLEYLRSEVKTMNFALKEHVSTRPRPTLRFSKPDLLGQQVIEVYTSAEQAGVVREAVSAYADNNPSLFDSDAPRETRNAQALTFICGDYLAGINGRAKTAGAGAAGTGGAGASAESDSNCGIPEAAASSNVAPGIQYHVRVNITYDEFVELCNSTDAHRTVPTDAGGRVRWIDIAGKRLNPIDAVAVIGNHGAQLFEAPWNRFFSPEQRDWAKAFQPYCAHPGCRVPATLCQAHHVVPISLGGTTTTDNEVLVCKRHHLLNDDTLAIPGRFHYAKDALGIPYLQEHPEQPGEPLPAARYNVWNLEHSPVLKNLRQRLSRGRSGSKLAALLPTGDGVILPPEFVSAIAAARARAEIAEKYPDQTIVASAGAPPPEDPDPPPEPATG